MENLNEQQQEQPFLNNSQVKEFIHNHKIDKKDYALLEKLSGFPIDLIVGELHNQFNLSHEKSDGQLKSRIEQIDKLLAKANYPLESFDKYKFEQTKELSETILAFFEKYGWEKSYSLVRILEETANKQSMLKEFFQKFSR